LTTNSLFPKRGDVWLANFDPTVGAEIKKIRPAVVVSSDSVGKLLIKLIAPVTDWKEYYIGNIWYVRCVASSVTPGALLNPTINRNYLSSTDV
jgi:mRNA interferase MazF